MNTKPIKIEEEIHICSGEVVKEKEILPNGDPSVLEVNVYDAISNKDLGPGQAK